ncbi:MULTISPECIES: prohibitin family protein [Calothrix]|uniref:Prohibitin family protein n=2 Tax=Calothrix TaxID=1186 RepID=A0ABR8A639_9CYAN|nr:MULTISPECIES: prohibitin family protein [Calothrix]MBD2195456.1 prohibitin family protein [Calothrix parietina FACHB-288]MBD2223118.1 prohibitin family protein [Calothrix anomala FACHB-343]
MKKTKLTNNAGKLTAFLVLLTIIITPFVIVNPGERGVLMEFGRVQQTILPEGIHAIIPLVNTVQKINVRIQKQEISAEASSKDLQDIFTDVALNWHIIPDEANLIFQEIGDEKDVVEKIINPAVEEVLKAVVAKYTAEEVVTKRGEVKSSVDDALTARLHGYHIAVDDISLVHVNFSDRFSEAVEAKQIAEQDAKRADFLALKAVKEAEAKVNLAKGEAEINRLLHDSLTPEIIERQAIQKWDGKLPLIMTKDTPKLLNPSEILKLK